MGLRSEIITTGEYYHIFNHSNGNEDIFHSSKMKKRFLDLINYYRFKQEIRYSFRNKGIQKKHNKNLKPLSAILLPEIEIFAFALMSNHFHLLVKQLVDGGISHFIRTVQDGYAKYFNKINKRKGSVFISPYRIKRIENDNIFLHLSRYIHLNPVTSFIIKEEELIDYKYTSLPYYINDINNKDKYPIINKRMILNMIGSKDKYLKFVLDHANYQKKLHLIKSLIFE